MISVDAAQSARRKAWVAMIITSLAVAAFTFVVCGLFGGFILMVALNGFSERQAQPIFIAYVVIVLGGCTLVAALLNWLILRRGFPAAGLPSWAALAPAAASAAGLLFVGPVLVVLIIRALG